MYFNIYSNNLNRFDSDKSQQPPIVTSSSSLAKLLDFPEFKGDANFSFGSAEDNAATSVTKSHCLQPSNIHTKSKPRSNSNNSSITPQTPPPTCPPPPPPPINMPLPLDTSNVGYQVFSSTESSLR